MVAHVLAQHARVQPTGTVDAVSAIDSFAGAVMKSISSSWMSSMPTPTRAIRTANSTAQRPLIMLVRVLFLRHNELSGTFLSLAMNGTSNGMCIACSKPEEDFCTVDSSLLIELFLSF